jgi:hypothetical protein
VESGVNFGKTFLKNLGVRQKLLLASVVLLGIFLVGLSFSGSVMDDINEIHELQCKAMDLQYKSDNSGKPRSSSDAEKIQELFKKADSRMRDMYKSRTSDADKAQIKYSFTREKRNQYCYSHGYLKDCTECPGR